MDPVQATPHQLRDDPRPAARLAIGNLNPPSSFSKRRRVIPSGGHSPGSGVGFQCQRTIVRPGRGPTESTANYPDRRFRGHDDNRIDLSEILLHKALEAFSHSLISPTSSQARPARNAGIVRPDVIKVARPGVGILRAAIARRAYVDSLISTMLNPTSARTLDTKNPKGKESSPADQELHVAGVRNFCPVRARRMYIAVGERFRPLNPKMIVGLAQGLSPRPHRRLQVYDKRQPMHRRFGPLQPWLFAEAACRWSPARISSTRPGLQSGARYRRRL